MSSNLPTSNFIIGYSGCGHCTKTRKVLDQAPPTSTSTIEYVDCTPGSASSNHPACYTSAPSVPAMVQCDPLGNCELRGVGARDTIEQFESVFASAPGPAQNPSAASGEK
jgi:hypothetical protein